MSGIGPTQGGFNEFVASQMGVPTYVLSAAPTIAAIGYAYDFAIQWVNPALVNIPGMPNAWSLYTLAIYNLAADTLINIAQDATPFVAYNPSGPQTNPPNALPYWQWYRAKFNVMSFVPGVVQSTSDEGTSAGYLVAEQFKNYTIANLQNLKTPYGRAYLGIVGSYGSLWGIS